ncbi:inner membrane protein [Pelagirhabdus alkalitolerans]|uniref:Inner membrane protein n=1 Tax=Pelagirhabdus alkalitolerans TaxID=1612202 RepID=A0A1G6IET2_9BACI|nr:metal-dependent hydrolase [Pelagirhabdus alkalitolerans]SDC05029.1 inner membrane protein [Pelagirhabdus alkalitolerans]
MDTGTHIAMGVALGGIATLDPSVGGDPVLFSAVMAGTVIGSHAPDFDTVLKLKSNAVYLRHHRGITHSIPLVLFWGLLISSLIFLAIPNMPYAVLWRWTTLAVVIHVFVDIFNAYGTQALRPFSNKWIALGFINTFDPVIFTAHIVGFGFWMLGFNPAQTFLTIYSLLVFYYLKRFLQKRVLERKIEIYYGEVEGIFTSPTINQRIWRLAITTKDSFYVARANHGNIQIVDQFERIPVPNNKLMATAKTDRNVAAFLSFSKVYRWEQVEYDDYTEVRFIDLRYRSKSHYPFVAVVKISEDLEILNSYTGWVFSEDKLQDKLLLEDV